MTISSKANIQVNHLAFIFCLVLVLPSTKLFAQNKQLVDTIDSQHVKVIAGKQYNVKPFKQWLYGKHYRKEWNTPVKIKIAYLDTLAGGLKPYQKGGGRQTKTLRLWDENKKEYVLRSIDKTFGGALPEIFLNSFVEKIFNDQVSIAHPYAAITIPPMAEAAGIYHTKPSIYYIPQQQILGDEYADYGDQLFLFEQRPDENWEEAKNFGSSENIVGTEKLFENLLEKNDHQPDQELFIKSRLFDMFIGDWGRHEDQWRWATLDTGKGKTYQAIPRDRDQVYTLFDGLLPSLATFISHQESFDHTIKNISGYNFPARNLDRLIANQMTAEHWIQKAKELQNNVSDKTIEDAIQQLPPEVFSISGPEIIAKLKSRKSQLQNFAKDYYTILAREVDIPGTLQNELFRVTVIDDQQVDIAVYDLNKKNQLKDAPFYKRRFNAGETKEIRLYGISGNDRFEVNATGKSPILVRMIGGPQKDVYASDLSKNQRVSIYDNEDNDFTKSEGLKKRLSENAFIHQYRYDQYKADSKGWMPLLFYSTEDRIYTGIAYQVTKQHWRKYPYGTSHRLAYHYSLSEGSYSTNYKGHFIKLLGEWNGNLGFNYDNIRWTNYFGIGNESILTTKDRDFHRMRTRDLYTRIGIDRLIAFHHQVDVAAFYHSVKLLHDSQRFLTDNAPLNKLAPYGRKHFGGLAFNYKYQKLNDHMLPTKGTEWETGVRYTQNLEQPDSAYTQYSTAVNFYLPLSKSFTLRLRAGGATLNGQTEFYQLNMLGGSETLRGYRRSRFYGKTMAFNQNELHFIKNVRSYIFNGKAGLMALLDAGRVWQPGEKSTSWHLGYGGGIILSPFDQLTLYVTYAFSKEDGDFGLRFYHKF